MKKPDITEAPWNIYDQNIVGNEMNGYICTWSGRRQNAKAISAVPEMIDALIMCLDFIEELKGHGIDEWSYEPKLREALKKAGCSE